MKEFEDIFNDLQNLHALCKVLACSLDECELTQFTSDDFSCCLHHLSTSLNYLMDEMATCLDYHSMN